MALTAQDDIHALRGQLLDSREQVVRLLEESSISDAEFEELGKLRTELSDFDTALFEAPFLKNTSLIAKLIGEIQEGTAAGQAIAYHLGEIRDAVKRVRKALKKGTSYLEKAKKVAKQVEGIVAAIEGGQ